MKISKNETQPYSWGADCKGWHLLNTPGLSVIQETMPPHTAEVTHKHQKAQQFFFILKGTAVFEINYEQVEVKAGEGIHIEEECVHKIKNTSDENLEFLVISQPRAHGDRVVVE